MSFDFSRIAELSTARGKLVELKNSAGRVIWAVKSAGDGKVILEVEKITSDTYAGETTYTGEQFILLDIYPKTNGTVSVTYGGLTKTITDTSGAAEPNAQQVFFGTFNGVSDSVATPASGELTIEGDYVAFGIGAYDKTSKDLLQPYCKCITAIISYGELTKIADYAFGSATDGGCPKLTTVEIPSQILSIGEGAFCDCEGLVSVTIKKGVKSIGKGAFNGCEGLVSVTIPASVTSIGENPFSVCNINNPVTLDIENVTYKMDGNCIIEIASNTLVSGFNDSSIPSYVTRIGRTAFNGLKGLRSVTIPGGVTSIDDFAFYNTTAESVTILAKTPPTLGGSCAFDGCSCSITVPAGCGEAYKTAEYWSEYANKIVEAS